MKYSKKTLNRILYDFSALDQGFLNWDAQADEKQIIKM